MAATRPKALSDKLTTTFPPSKISESSINPGLSHFTFVMVFMDQIHHMGHGVD